ncbi:MAG: DegT/DnrJ/EryC1/StrS family aminotransferase, partial [Bacteriovoracaceae bacterium]|nr:DegT/DnrJ/EryC1/StrS family aminotransferase [Bacteriovoracaceae bacterium]
KGETDLANMLGYNFRLGEIECAIGVEQLKKLEGIISRRQEIAETLNNSLSKLEGIQVPLAQKDCTHSYYVYPFVLDVDKLGVSRSRIKEALDAEGIQGLAEGYANLHLLPMYQKKVAYGSRGFPWKSEICKRDVSYDKGICPVAEELHDKTFLSFLLCLFDLSNEDLKQVIKAFEKVWSQMDKLRNENL